MATIKSYTDIEQSKTLAKILPIDSADMFYADLLVDGIHKYNPHPLESYGFKTFEDTKQKESKNLSFLPCWSLAALLNILPEINGISLKIEKIKAEDGYNGYYYFIEYEGIVLIPYSKNPVDSCCELILKLYELKIL